MTPDEFAASLSLQGERNQAETMPTNILPILKLWKAGATIWQFRRLGRGAFHSSHPGFRDHLSCLFVTLTECFICFSAPCDGLL
jgi:hypothetical protein